MKSIFTSLAAFLFLSQSVALFTQTSENSTISLEARAADTCGDPQASITFFQGYTRSDTAHLLSPLAVFVNNADLDGAFEIQNSIFRAWDTQQQGTVPLFQLFNAADPDNMFLRANPDGSLPSAPGYTIEPRIIYVYATQVCGSVPLYAMFKASATDHYYSIDPSDPLGWCSLDIRARGL
ncbi:hypothetical protein BDQ17DRAFT_1412882 [Cyathus striatus]|nr:hypothetical protein BDQ17DRAFT_1412882 [Cyathus striatus]